MVIAERALGIDIAYVTRASLVAASCADSYDYIIRSSEVFIKPDNSNALYMFMQSARKQMQALSDEV